MIIKMKDPQSKILLSKISKCILCFWQVKSTFHSESTLTFQKGRSFWRQLTAPDDRKMDADF